MMDKIRVFTVGGRSACGPIEFDTNVLVWGWRVGDVHAFPLSVQNTHPDEQEQDLGLGI